jgi:hypothetical protein
LFEPVATLGVGYLRRDLAAQRVHKARVTAFRKLIEAHENFLGIKKFAYCEAKSISTRTTHKKTLALKTKKLARSQLFIGSGEALN